MFEICSDIKPDTLSGAAEAPVANNVAAAINRDVRIMMSRRQVCEAKAGLLQLITKIHPLQLFAGISAPISRGGKNCNARTFALSFAQARRHDDVSLVRTERRHETRHHRSRYIFSGCNRVGPGLGR